MPTNNLRPKNILKELDFYVEDTYVGIRAIDDESQKQTTY